MATKKRPMGLKAQKHQHQQGSDPKKTRINDQDGSFTTVALVPSKDNEDGQEDGLTLADLIQLKNQADELIDNPSGLEADEDQLVNLLRGLCHEAVRQIDLAEQHNDGQGGRTSTTNLLHQLLAWATLELGIFLERHQNSERFSQPDEPKSVESWLSMSQIILSDHSNSADSEQENGQEDLSDLKFLPQVITILKSEEASEVLSSLENLIKSISNERQSTYLLRTIDRVILVEPFGIYREPTPIFKMLIECLKDIRDRPRSNDTKPQDLQTFHRLIDQRLAGCYLAHASILAEELEGKYYHDERESNDETSKDQEEFPIDTKDPIYVIAIDQLHLAEEAFSTLLKEMDEKDESQSELKTKLKETYLTRGNLTAPGPEREKLYLLGDLGQQDDQK